MQQKEILGHVVMSHVYEFRFLQFAIILGALGSLNLRLEDVTIINAPHYRQIKCCWEYHKYYELRTHCNKRGRIDMLDQISPFEGQAQGIHSRRSHSSLSHHDRVNEDGGNPNHWILDSGA